MLAQELRAQDPVADDRPCDQVREEGDEERVAQRVALGRQVAAVHVDRVRDSLERVEADADRQDDPVEERVQAGEALRRDHSDEARQVPADERRVLERAEQGEQRGDREREHGPAAVALEHTAADVPDRRRGGHQEREPPLRIRVEDVARNDDQDEPGAMAWHHEVRDDDHREEDEEEGEAVEQHGLRVRGGPDHPAEPTLGG